MARKKIKSINCWEDLINWIETINPYDNTIVLSGWINELGEDGKINIKTLVFNKVDISILLDVHQDKYAKKKRKKKNVLVEKST